MTSSQLATECGIFAFFNPNTMLPLTTAVQGLEKLQHRGQESSGLSYVAHNNIFTHKRLGFVEEVYTNLDSNLRSSACLGHVRYSTSGSKGDLNHIQPIGDHSLTIAHNGNIPNLPGGYTHDTTFLYDVLTGKCSLGDSEDSEDSKDQLESNLRRLVEKVPGAYCLCILTTTAMYVVRDRYGIRPLCIGKDPHGTWVVSSESVAFSDTTQIVHDMYPGEILKICPDGSTRSVLVSPVKRTHCLFEYIYFLRKDSIADGIHVEEFRQKCGAFLAKQESCLFLAENTIVVGAPYTGIPSAKEYARCIGVPYVQVIRKIKKRRTFILPDKREKTCDTIYEYDENKIAGKRIIVVDDSVVRGTTIPSIANQLWNYGAKEIHIRVASPPVVSQCYFGIDIPTKDELVAFRNSDSNNNVNMAAIAKEMGITSLRYLTLEETQELLGGNNYCSGCFTGKYPDKLLDW
jgi:amidophosphoribosyltransferase